MSSKAHKEGYDTTVQSAKGPVQTYPKNPYNFKQNLEAFLDWHIGAAKAQSDLFIASYISQARSV